MALVPNLSFLHRKKICTCMQLIKPLLFYYRTTALIFLPFLHTANQWSREGNDTANGEVA